MKSERVKNFIQEFIKIGKLTQQQKDKMIELFVREIAQKSYTSEKELKSSNNLQGKPHKPKDTFNFLLNFSNSNFIKYLTHRFNSEVPDYDCFINELKKEFEKEQKKYPNVSDKVLARIRQFAFEENPKWYIYTANEKIDFEIGWSTEKFKKWYNEHKKHPADDDFWNRKMIIPFKESVELRTGNLLKMIKSIQDQYNVFEIKTNNLEQAEFYTNVDMLHQAFQKIFGCIKDNAVKKFQFEVKITFEKAEEMNTISITHIGSECKRKSDYKFEKGDFNDLKNNLWGIGNLEIEAKFEDGYFRKYILTDDTKKINEIEKITSIEGFTYILKFY